MESRLDKDYELARRADEAGVNALPGIRQVLLGDWLLRFSGGVTRRGNSVTPLRPGRPDAARLRQAEALYAAQGLPCIVRLPSYLGPALDEGLAALGYTAPEGETRILYCAELGGQARPDIGVEMVAGQPTAEWLAAQAAIAQDSPALAAARGAMLAGLAIPAMFGGIRMPGLGLAALASIATHDGIACVNMVVTHPAARRQGLSRRLLGVLLGWAHENGAEGASLQVAADNAGAVALYEGLGFGRELYRYRYRRAG